MVLGTHYMENWTGYRYPHLFRIWNAWVDETHWHQLDRWLRRYFQGQRSFGKRDRMAYANAMFSAMRILELVGALERQYGVPGHHQWQEWDLTWTPNQVKNIRNDKFWFWVALYHDVEAPAPTELADAEARREWFVTQCADQSNRVALGLEDFWQGWRPQWNAALQARAEKSQWSDSDVAAFKAGQNVLPPVWLRLQKGAEIEQVQAQLSDEGVLVSIVDNKISARGGAGLLETTAFKTGQFEIQDYASQLIADSVAVSPGEKVWDACAGAGGKTLSLAEKMASKGALIATDIREYKLNELKRRAKKADYFNIRTFMWDAEAPLKLPREVRVQQGFDKVLIDAPCSSTGTWRRNPDARWRNSEMADQDLLNLQQHILSQASQSVRPGGNLVYATCSWLVEENEDQVTQFLAAHDQFELISQSMVGFPQIDSDAMFTAVLQKRA